MEFIDCARIFSWFAVFSLMMFLLFAGIIALLSPLMTKFESWLGFDAEWGEKQ